MTISERKKFELICEVLNENDLPLIIKQLTNYARFRFQRWQLLDEKGVEGYSPKDVALEAIEKVIVGEWNWDPDKIELIPYLKYCVIKGLVANLARRQGVQRSDNEEASMDNASSKFTSPDDELHAKQIIEIVQKNVEWDEKMEIVWLGLSDGLPPRDTCEMFDITPNEYKNAHKRLKTQFDKLIEAGTFKSLKE